MARSKYRVYPTFYGARMSTRVRKLITEINLKTNYKNRQNISDEINASVYKRISVFVLLECYEIDPTATDQEQTRIVALQAVIFASLILILILELTKTCKKHPAKLQMTVKGVRNDQDHDGSNSNAFCKFWGDSRLIF
ncbi:hypothetical protein BDR07DRAFT_1544144 [Suillus spraguei]|nr:hypothetical protein BDR07DRAFT_1544144 [Suillus spraguei]